MSNNLLGVKMQPGGKHAFMGTHNNLLSLGNFYLEVIAIDPEGIKPGRPRWFDLDNFKGAPRLTNWIAQCPDIATRVDLPPGVGRVVPPMSRGDYKWQMALPDDGTYLFDGMFPALIEWQCKAHPTQSLNDVNCTFEHLHIQHPRGDSLKSMLSQLMDTGNITITVGEEIKLQAAIRTPTGIKML